MLASTYLKQQKYDTAEALLLPLAEPTMTSESLRTLLFCRRFWPLNSGDTTSPLDLAEKYSITAYNGRRKEIEAEEMPLNP
jgi:hypothetical protein